jgi:D-3-phosphoglycerate dehydrogenase
MKLILDFDSTIIQKEALDVLAEIVLKQHPEASHIKKAIHDITDDAMTGKIPFDIALQKRIAFLNISRQEIIHLIAELNNIISSSFEKNIGYLQQHAQDIYVVSGGFKEYIIPVVKSLGILESHVFANEFIFNEVGQVIGFETANLLSQHQGKVKMLKQLNFNDDVTVIGDGYTDYELYEHGMAKNFYLYAEHVLRKKIAPLATKIIYSFDDFLA